MYSLKQRKQERLESYEDILKRIPSNIRTGTYRINPPLIKPSRLTRKEKGGNGKDLSDGWVVNYAIGCLHACIFCYVDVIHKKFPRKGLNQLVRNRWGYYFAIPSNIIEAINETPWHKWSGIEVLMSSTHDPYLSQLITWTRKILEHGLSNGVRFLIQTRSHLVLRDLDILSRHRNQVRLQVSIATINKDFSRAIEPRAPPPEKRIEILREAKENANLTTGAIIAPVFPPNIYVQDVYQDLLAIAERLTETKVDKVYGESLHPRGPNMEYIKEALGVKINLKGWDIRAEKLFYKALDEYGLKGEWWPERY